MLLVGIVGCCCWLMLVGQCWLVDVGWLMLLVGVVGCCCWLMLWVGVVGWLMLLVGIFLGIIYNVS